MSASELTNAAEVPIPGRGHSRRLLLGLVYQAVAVAAVATLIGYVALNVADNLAARGLGLGFGFLSQEAGFRIGFRLIAFSEADSYGRAFLVGLANTMLVVALSIVLATILGFVFGIARLSANWPVSRLALGYIEVVRNLPLLLHLLFWYNVALRTLPPVRLSATLGGVAFLNNRGLFLPRPVLDAGAEPFIATLVAGLAMAAAWIVWAKRHRNDTGRRLPVATVAIVLALGLPCAIIASGAAPLEWQSPELRAFDFVGGLKLIPELVALVIALTVYNAAFIAEIVRCSIEAVSPGQAEAAQALGLKRGRTLQLVVIPQALRVLIPPLSSQYVQLIKASSLATAIGYPDVVNVFAGTVLNQTGRAIEVVLITMAVYLALSTTIALATNAYNRHIRIVER